MKLFSKLYFAVFLLLMFSACSDSSGNNEVDDSNTDCDCPAGEICDGEGGCLTVCEKDDDCPATFYCDEEKSYCVPTIIEEDGDLDDDSWWEFDIPEGPEFGFESETEHDVVWETDVEHSTTSPWLEFDPKRLDFGAVPLGSSTDKEVIVSNLGNAKLEISEIYL